MSTFISNSPKWQCCCFHLTTGCNIIAAIEVVSTLCGFGGLLTGALVMNITWMLLSIYIVSAVICLSADVCAVHVFHTVPHTSAISCVLVLVGIRRRQAVWLYPYIVVHGVIILAVCALIVISLLLPTSTHDHSLDHYTPSTSRLVTSLCGALALSLLLVFCIYTVTRCSHYLGNLERRNNKRYSMRVKRRAQGDDSGQQCEAESQP